MVKAKVFGSFFLLANKLQVIGDKLDPNVTTKQWLFLATLLKNKDFTGISNFSKSLGYSRQNAKRIAESLEKKGFLKIDTSKEDNRVQNIKMTDYGINHLKSRNSKEKEFIDKLYLGISDEELELLDKTFMKLFKNIESMKIDYSRMDEND